MFPLNGSTEIADGIPRYPGQISISARTVSGRLQTCVGSPKEYDQQFSGSILKYRWTGGDQLTADLVVVVVLNSVVVYLLLMGTVKVVGTHYDQKSIIAASLISGIYYGVCLVVHAPIFSALITRLTVFFLVTVTAFGMNRSTLTKCGVYFVLGMALEGSLSVYSADNPLPVLLFAGGIAALCALLRKKSIRRKSFSEIIIYYMGKTVRMNALRDTGNTLTDPVTGEGIVIIGPKAAADLTGLSREELANPVETLCSAPINGLRLISFSSVGNARGLMLALRFNHTVVDSVRGSILVGMAAEGMDGYDAIIGGDHDH